MSAKLWMVFYWLILSEKFYIGMGQSQLLHSYDGKGENSKKLAD
jgi:hypothetical protein